VSALGRVKMLNRTGCTGVRDVSTLGWVETLHLYSCTGVSDFSAVQHANGLPFFFFFFGAKNINDTAFFEEEGVGVSSSVSYSPVQRGQIRPHSQVHLRESVIDPIGIVHMILGQAPDCRSEVIHIDQVLGRDHLIHRCRVCGQAHIVAQHCFAFVYIRVRAL